MEKQFECTKIKDGLYLGNIRASQDIQFLITNKFSYIVNCAYEIPNYFEDSGIKYLNYKLIKDKPYKLWDQNNFKKLDKLDKFLEKVQKLSLCCLFISYDGINRNLVMLCGYFMKKYHWKLAKCLEFIRSRNVFIGLSQYNIQQLENLQIFLEQPKLNCDGQTIQKIKLTRQWRIIYRTQSQQILSKTYLNSQQSILNSKKLQNKQNIQHTKQYNQISKHFAQKQLLKKTIKRVTWQLDKNIKQKKIKKIKNKQLLNNQNCQNYQNIVDIKNNHTYRQLIKQNIQKSIQNQKKQFKKKDNSCKNFINQFPKQIDILNNNKKYQSQQIQDNFKNKKILQIIKNNIKDKIIQNQISQNKQKIYNFTINNYIQPQISIVNAGGKDKKNVNKIRPDSFNKQQKINRSQSKKQQLRYQNIKTNKPKIQTISPGKKQKKVQKTSSLQFKKTK